MTSAMGVAVAAAKATTGTQNITTADLGGLTPVAVLFYFSRSPTDAVVTTDSQISLGVTDGTNQLSYAYVMKDGVPKYSMCYSKKATDCVLCSLSTAGAVHSQAAFSAFITNGVTIDWSVASNEGWLITALFFAGTDWTAKVGLMPALTGSYVQGAVVNLGFVPDCVWGFNAGDYVTYGSAVQGPGELQHSHGFITFQDAESCIDVWAGYYGIGTNSACIGGQQGVWNRYLLPCQQSAVASGGSVDGFTVSSQSAYGAGHIWGYFALKYAGTGHLKSGRVGVTLNTAKDYPITGVGAAGGFLLLYLAQAYSTEQADLGDIAKIRQTHTISNAALTKTGGFSFAARGVDHYSRTAAPYVEVCTANQDSISAVHTDGTIELIAHVKSYDADGFTITVTTPIASTLDAGGYPLIQADFSLTYLTLVGGPAPPPPPPPPPPPVPHTAILSGNLIGATYRRVSAFTTEAPAFVGWHRHDLGHARSVANISMGGRADGLLDRLNMVTTDGDKYFVEGLTQIFDEDDSINDAFFLDGAMVPDSSYEDTYYSGFPAWLIGTSYAVGTYVNDGGVSYIAIAPSVGIQPAVNSQWTTYWRTAPGLRLTGLYWLTGKTVAAWVLGLDVGNYTVDANSTIYVPYGSGTAPGGVIDYTAPGAGQYLFTAAAVAAAVAANETPRNGGAVYTPGATPVVIRAVCGYTFTSDGQLLRPIAPDATGAKEGPAFGKLRRQHRLAMLLQNSLGLQVGTDFTTMYQAVLKSYENGPQLDPQHPFSGMWRDHVWNEYDMNSMLSWRIVRPYPASVVAIGGHIETQDI